MDEDRLPPHLAAAVEEFANWSKQQLLTEQEETKITTPLYQYTNAAGLRGIIESQKIWFGSYLHLNDPSELTYGMDILHRLLNEIQQGADDPFVGNVCWGVSRRLQHPDFSHTFGFYIASFSRNRDELGQWRAYADNGRGFALGLAPHLFEVVNMAVPKPTEYVVMPVVYGQEKAEQRYRAAIDAAARIITKIKRPQPPEAFRLFLRTWRTN